MAETRTIRTVLELNASRFQAGAAAAAKSAKEVQSELGRITDSSGKFRAEYDRAGTALLGLGGAAVTGLGLATKAAMDWESVWAGVRKTVDGTDAQMAELEQGLRGLAKELPASHEEIAAVAEAAGQLGVAREDVVDFTRTMINLGETTNLSADEAATAIAQFSNVMHVSADDTDNFGAALVDLGNKGASTEADILNMAQRLSGTGALIGASSQDILGLSSALADVGISAEAGGGSISRVLQKMNTEVLDSGDKLEVFAETAGMTSEEFAAAWRESPIEAFQAVEQGLQKVTDSGGNAVGVLKEMGIKSSEEVRSVLSLASNYEGLGASLDTSNQAWAENTALVAEAAKRYETTESKVQLARNALVDAGIDLGSSVLPVLATVAEGAAGVADAFTNLPGPLQNSLVLLGSVAGASALLAGGLMKVVPAAAETIQSFRTLKAESPKTASALTKVGGAVGKMTVALAATSALSSLGNSFTDFSIGANEAADIALRTADAVDPLGTVFAGMGEDSYLATAGTADLADTLSELANGGALGTVSDGLAGLVNVFGADISTLEDARQRLEEVGQAIAGLYESDPERAAAAFTNLWDAFGGGQQAGTDLLDTMPALRDELVGVANAAGLATDDATLLKIASGEITPVMDDTTGAASGLSDGLDDVATAAEDAKAATDDLVDSLVEQGSAFLSARDSARQYEESVGEAMTAAAENGKAWEDGTDKAHENAAALDDLAQATLDNIGALRDAGDPVSGFMQDARDEIIKTAESMGASEEEAEAYADALGLAPDDITTVVNLETEEAQAKWDALWGDAGFHPPEVEVPVGVDTNPAVEGVQSFQGTLSTEPPTDLSVGADTAPAEGDVQGFVGVLEGEGADVPVGADTTLAEADLYGALTEIENSGGTITIDGETYTAEQALSYLLSQTDGSTGTMTIEGDNSGALGSLNGAVTIVNNADGTITIRGDNSGAKSSADSAKSYTDGKRGVVDVDGNNTGAKASADGAANYASGKTGRISVTASTSSAETAINHAARDRTSRITVTYSDPGFRGGGGSSGFAGGGWLRDGLTTPGLSAGGWVPGPYPGKGVDNVLWPSLAGAASGRLLSQPLAGTEYVVNGQSAQTWGPALEAINSGVSPKQLAELAARPSTGGRLALTQNITGQDPATVAALALENTKHFVNTQSTGYRGA
ncbi:phage tail tape measure protein [Brachybacterium sp. NBEC-018]|uniref:phage tail tape measure protein n=1 Tax=Brachybacterium sp. NBEC-018 TaxID=2996004 RepID=UPI002175269D|nr:phage tail tape measure protein [Brachybacterium sp. NBEC-018]UVY83791.1 phage tail tape measure protein [Brachybacterium sp. NBEC-018]